MSLTVFVVAFIAAMSGMLIFLFLNIKPLPVVKAGKVNKMCGKTKYFFGYMPDKILINGVKVDLTGYEKMCVNGNSMKDYRIHHGQRIYVKRILSNEKGNISKYPVLVFNIVDSPNKNDAQFKLRKFVGYINSDNWEEVYNDFITRIRISKSDFIAQCIEKYKKTPVDKQQDLILSETFDEDQKKNLYSLHPADTIYGKVEYAL